ncbi:MAG: tetratricopeptide repeat protein, partial [Chloroflexi bacterium]|nr:tetratricopeptide repeat protein [Chloroflexota bacterium]
MSKTTLSACLQRAQEAMEAEQYGDAIETARHILRHYPTCIAAYELMGEACLEQGQNQEAADLFRRVLSADPQGCEALLGLASVNEAEGETDEALRYLELAMDVLPGHTGIRRELLRLTAEQGNAVPSRLKVTRPALAHTLARNNLYEQAILEYRTALEREPERLDLLLGLAETLWHHGRRIEAAEVCQQ